MPTAFANVATRGPRHWPRTTECCHQRRCLRPTRRGHGCRSIAELLPFPEAVGAGYQLTRADRHACGACRCG